MPLPACSTQPSTTSPTSLGATRARQIASRTTMAPRSAADRSFKPPPNEPIGVRQAPRMTTSKSLFKRAHLLRNEQRRASGAPDLVQGRVSGDLAQQQPRRRHLDHGQFSDDQVHYLQAGERQRAALHDLVTAVS